MATCALTLLVIIITFGALASHFPVVPDLSGLTNSLFINRQIILENLST